MAPYFDEMQAHTALRQEGLPALRRLADNPLLRDHALHRFNHDDPPPYRSSTEEDEDDVMYHPALGLNGDNVLDESQDIMAPPLDDTEQDEVEYRLNAGLHPVYSPETRYRIEQRIEHHRIEVYSGFDGDAKKLFDSRGMAKFQRFNIVVRHNIRRRWQKLGVWNPQWGIPGLQFIIPRRPHSQQPRDDPAGWQWRWQQGSRDANDSKWPHPITRAVRLRQGLHRNEHTPVPPRSHLQDDASAPQAESFIISRPWFMYRVELQEERARFERIPFEKQRLYTKSMATHLSKEWKRRGDWKEAWDDRGSGNFVPGWKWPHESPSPEPEDLSALNTMDMDFTPSEADALEAVRPDTPPPERRYEPPDPRLGPVVGLFGPHLYALPEESRPADTPEAKPHSVPRQRQRQRQQCHENPPQPLRRSARIAARRIDQPLPLPPQEARQTSRAIPARPPADRPKRGRPKKGNGPAVSKAPSERVGRARRTRK